ncbi:hypothetical protein SADUNF_Sadunf16G0067000 [Salix dunnii]|uniref:Uncharacterized protein n=1 Tax=Salix dunnii TaxID=1413687 RepID=A0A835MG80_9ROSI|nr:hypothetical protein SADUNF_Sadunf16G0067000 [Salix dunnii]
MKLLRGGGESGGVGVMYIYVGEADPVIEINNTQSNVIENAPIFLYTRKEGGIEWFAQNTGFMFDIAPRFKALLVLIEHRFYGKSMPYEGDKNVAYSNSSTLFMYFNKLYTYRHHQLAIVHKLDLNGESASLESHLKYASKKHQLFNQKLINSFNSLETMADYPTPSKILSSAYPVKEVLIIIDAGHHD